VQGEKKSRKSKQENKFRKSNNRFKKLKIKTKKKEGGKGRPPPRTAKAQCKGRGLSQQ